MTEKPTLEHIVAALNCEGRTINCPVKDCHYNTVINFGGDTLCAIGALHHDAADMIEQQAARIRELESVVHLCDTCQKCYPECDSEDIEFGCGKGNDNVVKCGGYVQKEVKPDAC